MAVPAFPNFIPVMLKFLAEAPNNMASHKELREHCVAVFNLTPADIAETLPSGQSRLANRIYWGVSYFRMAGLIENTGTRGVIRLTTDGQSFYATHRDNATLSRVKSLPKFIAHQTAASSECRDMPSECTTIAEETPVEAIARAVDTYNATLAAELLQEIYTNLSNDDFEKLCVMLLIKMGYGKPELNQDSVTPHSGDGGIDGIVKGDPLGFDSIYLQAKKYGQETTVGPNLIREFVGAMSGKRNGAFITTSRFTKQAIQEARRNIDKHLVLIDGPALLKYMIEYGLGVQTIATYAIRRVDYDFFLNEL